MAEKDPTTLKTYFETGDVPDENQFADLIESSFNKVEGLGKKVTFNSSASFTVPAERKLVDLDIWTDVTQTIKVGTTEGGNELMEDTVSNTEPYSLDIGIFYSASQDIFITGTAGTINVKYYIK